MFTWKYYFQTLIIALQYHFFFLPENINNQPDPQKDNEISTYYTQVKIMHVRNV